MSRIVSRIMSRISWDDLRYVLAVAAEGSLAGAARSPDMADVQLELVEPAQPPAQVGRSS